MSNSTMLNELTEAFDQYDGVLSVIKRAVHSSASDPDGDERARRVGATALDAAVLGATGVAKAVLDHLLGHIDPVELGRWYISCFELNEWSMLMWTDPHAFLDDEECELMREELLAVRDTFGFGYPDEEAVFAYLADDRNDLGDPDQEMSAFDIATLWKRRFVYAYTGFAEVADDWISEHDTGRIVNDLYEVASESAVHVLGEIKDGYGSYLVEQQADQRCYLDRIDSHGDLLCLRRRDA